MRQMDDDLIVRIATIQAIVMSLLFQAAAWLQLQGQETIPVSFSFMLLMQVSLDILLISKS